jgi:hypothetical protein
MKLMFVRLMVGMSFLLFVPSISRGISLNDGIYTTVNLNVRQTPSTSGTLVTTVSAGTAGLVVGGPTISGGYTWWQITWGSPNVTGWSIQDYLATTSPGPYAYSDYFSPGWHINSWPNTTSLSTSTTRRSGAYGIYTNATASWARLYIRTTIGFNASGQQTLRFSMMSPAGNGQNHYIALYNMSGYPITYLPVWNYVSGNTLVPNTWYDIVIPVSDLGAVNQTVGGVVVEIGSAGQFYIDEVTFSAVSGSTYWTPPSSTVTSVSASCSPSSILTNNSSQCNATVTGTGNYNSTVTWTASVGQISSSGLYTAPASAPSPSGVLVTARSIQDTSKSGNTTVTVNAQQTNQALVNVFSDTLGLGWFVGGWSGLTTDASSDVSFEGEYGMEVNIATANYGRLQLRTVQGYKHSTSGSNYLSFAINTGKSEGELLYVGLLNVNGTVNQYVNLAPYTLTQRFEAYQWQVVNIPLTDLFSVNSDVYGVEIQSIYPSTFFVDNVMFTGVACNVQ